MGAWVAPAGSWGGGGVPQPPPHSLQSWPGATISHLLGTHPERLRTRAPIQTHWGRGWGPQPLPRGGRGRAVAHTTALITPKQSEHNRAHNLSAVNCGRAPRPFPGAPTATHKLLADAAAFCIQACSYDVQKLPVFCCQRRAWQKYSGLVLFTAKKQTAHEAPKRGVAFEFFWAVADCASLPDQKGAGCGAM